MAEFTRLVITNKGQALLAKLMAGANGVNFTKVSASSTAYNESALQSLTALTNVKQTSAISKITRTNNVAIKVEAAFTNTDLTAGYYMRTLGLYAADPDEGEILYAATSETSGNCYMPAYNGLTVSGALIQLVTTVGNAENVSLEVNPGAVATIGDIEELQGQISDLAAYVGYNDADIYGVEVDYKNKRFTRLAAAVGKTGGASFDNVPCFGGRKRCNVTNDGAVTAYYGDAAYTTSGKLTVAVTVNGTTYPVGTPVQTMVEQPKFYYKVVPVELEIIDAGKNKGHHMRKGRYYVSPVPKAGFKLHPAFIENGKTNDFIYLAAFEGSLYDFSASLYIMDDSQVAAFTAAVGAGDMLSSIANAKPISGLTQNLTRANTRILARNRGAGWEQSYAATIAATQLLMLIEYATFDMQKAIGNGNVSKVDDGRSNMSELTGATVNLGNASGAVTNANGIQLVSYRGEENPYGNIWTWVDGMNSYSENTSAIGDHGSIYVADHGFADDTSAAPYQDTGIHPLRISGGFISAFGYSEDFDWLFIPTEASGNSVLPVGDYFWNGNPGWRVAILGGRWYGGLHAGAFCWSLYDASSDRARPVGGRLVYVPSQKAA